MSEPIPLDADAGEHSAGRQVHDDERRLLQRVRQHTENQPDDVLVSLVALGEQVGIHPMRSRELGRTWQNEGRYRYAGDSPDRGKLTEKGRNDDLPR